jgi:hypothetical protein
VALFSRGLTRLGGAVKKDGIAGFTAQAFFTLVENHDGELEDNILQQISRVNWNYWSGLCDNVYEIDFKMFFQKV